jgi:hypothetical protein
MRKVEESLVLLAILVVLPGPGSSNNAWMVVAILGYIGFKVAIYCARRLWC